MRAQVKSMRTSLGILLLSVLACGCTPDNDAGDSTGIRRILGLGLGIRAFLGHSADAIGTWEPQISAERILCYCEGLSECGDLLYSDDATGTFCVDRPSPDGQGGGVYGTHNLVTITYDGKVINTQPMAQISSVMSPVYFQSFEQVVPSPERKSLACFMRQLDCLQIRDALTFKQTGYIAVNPLDDHAVYWISERELILGTSSAIQRIMLPGVTVSDVYKGGCLSFSQHGLSPDKRFLLFSEETPSSDARLILLDLRDGRVQCVTDSESVAWDPCWSADGTRFAYVRDFQNIASGSRDNMQSTVIKTLVDKASVRDLFFLQGDQLVCIVCEHRSRLRRALIVLDAKTGEELCRGPEAVYDDAYPIQGGTRILFQKRMKAVAKTAK